MALSDRALKAWRPGKVRRMREDGASHPELRGMFAEIGKGGGISFFLGYTRPKAAGGGRTTISLGTYPSTTLAAARRECALARAQLQQGLDPRDERKNAETVEAAKRAALDSRGTVTQLFDAYISGLEQDGKRSASEVRRAYQHDIGPVIGDCVVADLIVDDILDCMSPVVDRGRIVLANRLRSYMVSALEFALHAKSSPRWRHRVPDFDIAYNVAKATRRAGAERVGNRSLTWDEAVSLWRGLDRSDLSRGYQLTLQLMLLCGCRVEEALHARRSEFNLEEHMWLIPGSRRKKGSPLAIPLTSMHLQVLEQAPGGELLFPGAEGGPAKLWGLNQALSRLCHQIGIERLTPRDLRRTWKSLAGTLGIDLELRNRLQGHAFTDVGSRHYDRFDYLPQKRDAMRLWCEALECRLAAPATVVRMVR
jgi:integrase